jgi:hypothetical protein
MLSLIFVVAIILLIGKLFLSFLKVKKRDWIFFLSAGVFALSLKMALERIPL